MTAVKMVREWTVGGARFGYYLHKAHTLRLHNSIAITSPKLADDSCASARAKPVERTALKHPHSTR
jgi:hypothetical protein